MTLRLGVGACRSRFYREGARDQRHHQLRLHTKFVQTARANLLGNVSGCAFE